MSASGMPVFWERWNEAAVTAWGLRGSRREGEEGNEEAERVRRAERCPGRLSSPSQLCLQPDLLQLRFPLGHTTSRCTPPWHSSAGVLCDSPIALIPSAWLGGFRFVSYPHPHTWVSRTLVLDPLPLSVNLSQAGQCPHATHFTTPHTT